MAEISNVSWRSVIGSKRCQHSVTKSRSSLCEPRLRTGRNRMALSYIQGWDLNHFKEWELMCACLWQRTERFWVESRCNMDVFLLSSENIRNSIFFQHFIQSSFKLCRQQQGNWERQTLCLTEYSVDGHQKGLNVNWGSVTKKKNSRCQYSVKKQMSGHCKARVRTTQNWYHCQMGLKLWRGVLIWGRRLSVPKQTMAILVRIYR